MLRILNFFLDIFFPKRCINCGDYGEIICQDCLQTINLLKTSVCPECGKLTEYCRFCSSCKSRLKNKLYSLIIASRYESGLVKELIHELKYQGLTDSIPILSSLICARIINLKQSLENCVVVPVPLFYRKEKARGFNQAELIARSVSKSLNLPGGSALKRIKNTSTQVGLSRLERVENLKDAFVCEDTDLICGKVVLLIDDVTTTGSTLGECAKVLINSGSKKIIGVVVAKRM